jgi:hypothetical protein
VPKLFRTGCQSCLESGAKVDWITHQVANTGVVALREEETKNLISYFERLATSMGAPAIILVHYRRIDVSCPF